MKKLDELERNEYMYKGLMDHTKHVIKAFIDMCNIYKGIIFFEFNFNLKQVLKLLSIYSFWRYIRRDRSSGTAASGERSLF